MNASRREFFGYGAAGLSGAVAAMATGARAAATGAAAQPPRKPVKFRISGRWGTMGASGAESFAVAKKLGLEGVEIEACSGKPGDVLDCCKGDVQQAFLDAMKQNDVVLSSICMGHCNSYPVFSDPRAKQWLEGTIDATAAMGAKAILVPFFGNGNLQIKDSKRPDPEKLNKAVEVIKGVAARAEAKGITLALENTLSAEDNIAMVEKVGSPAVRVYYDIGNSTGGGYDILKEIRLLGTKYMAIIHFKDGNDLLGQGKINMAAVRDAVLDTGYEGWIVLETSGRPLGPELSAVYNAAFIRGLFCV